MATFTRDFHHPYEPYGIQVQLMSAVYECIVDGKVGIFESPTGTGKSLSLICSTLTWLRDEQQKAFDEGMTIEGEDTEPAWLVEQAKRHRVEQLVQQRLEIKSRLDSIRRLEARQKRQYEKGEPATKRLKGCQQDDLAKGGDESQFLLDDYESGNEAREPAAAATHNGGLSDTTLQLMQKLSRPSSLKNEDAQTEPVDELKIFFCSRTHSQLNQLTNELRRVKLPLASWLERASSSSGSRQQSFLKHIPLGSRKNLCINPKVAGAVSTTAINERCVELQQPSTPREKKCVFIPSKDNEVLVNDFREHALAKIRDIEDLGALGKRIGICPYYASRASIKPSEYVTLPYQLLLLKAAREALGISLKGHVVVIDEAHNLMDVISNMYSITVTRPQLHQCQSQLRIYLQKFRNKLKGKNRVYVTQIVRLIDSICLCLDKTESASHSNEILVKPSDLMGGKGVDQINLYKLIRYLSDSKLARKVDSYIDFAVQHGLSDLGTHGTSTPVLTHVQGFLQTLMNPAAEGRFFLERDESNVVILRYMLLDPTFHFREVVEDARAVILAGGTMSPMEDYARHLFAYIPSTRLKTWSCGHIIPRENLFVRCIGQCPDGTDLDFSFTRRDSTAMIGALGSCLVEMTATIPDGLVVFFPSYAYLDRVATEWQSVAADPTSIWTRLAKNKPIFEERKGAPGAEDVLQQYSKAIDDGTGGILLAVVGGKLSEGINFSDKLGRGVAVVGLPFPNIYSAEWKARLEYIEQRTVDGGASKTEGKAAGRDFYENACMRAVNQSIGRAIRHQKDYASISLLDRRYSTPRIMDKLPGWIKQGLPQGNAKSTFPDIIRDLQDFFNAKD